MKYYTYVSDAKLDMLYAQVPKRILDRIAVELQIDLKVVKFALKERPTEQNRYDRLAIVTAYVERDMEVGSIDEPMQWFRGTAPIVQARAGGREEAVVLFASDMPRTVLGLTGSLRHVIGDVSGSVFSGSSTAGAVDANSALRSLDRTQPIEDGRAVDALRGLVERTTRKYEGTELPSEFLAQRLAYQPRSRGTSQAFLLGTPLYVARGENA